VEPASFFAASRLVIVAGKGGVGKTVVSAALARSAAAHGVRTLLVEVEGKAATHALFAAPALGYRSSLLLPAEPDAGRAEIRGRSLTPDDALVDYLEGHGMQRMAKRLARSGALEVIATATPGIKDILVLGKVKQLANGTTVDLIVLDAPAAGHAVSFLRAAPTLLDTSRSGPINHQASQVLAMLTDPARCQVVLVTIPEETPVNELVETAYALEDDVGVRLGPIVVNGIYDPIAGLADGVHAADPAVAAALTDAAAFRLHRQDLQQRHIDRLRRELPLEQLHLPYLFDQDPGPQSSARLAGHLTHAILELPDHAVRHG
jgi:anion-transporting  ArsA/GET3 family ATPase